MRNGALRNRGAAVADGEDLDLRRGILGAFVVRLLMRNPRDSVVAILAAAAVAAIIVNGLFLQPGPHPAPMFAVRPLPVAPNESTGGIVPRLPRPRPAEAETGSQATPTALRPRPEIMSAPKAPPAGRSGGQDAIAVLLAPSRQILAIQRALSDYGYGPLKATGIYDADTRATIERFERDRKLPITGQISERVMRELAALTGRPLE